MAITINGKQDTGRTRHDKCTGLALQLANAHQAPADITLFAACYSPFSQRVWIALELLGIPYKASSSVLHLPFFFPTRID
jgi:glutathione S-transferase